MRPLIAAVALCLSTSALALPGGGPCRDQHGQWAAYATEGTGVPIRLSATWSLTLPEPLEGGVGRLVAESFNTSDIGWVDPEQPIQLTLANGSTVALPVSERRQGEPYGGNATRWILPLAVDADAVRAIAASPATLLTLSVGEARYTQKVKGGKAKALQTAAACLVADASD
jgi:hypothetical protein